MSDQIKDPNNAATDAVDAVEDDAEGHNLWINPGTARDLTRSRDVERQRELEKRQQAKDAKSR